MARELILKLGKKITDRVDVKLGMTQLDETSPEYYGLASVVTDEMAELALAMKVRVPTTPAEIGKKVGKDPVYVEQLFDQMSMIGLLEYNWENADHHKQCDPLEGHQQTEIRQPPNPFAGIPLAQVPNPFQQFVHLGQRSLHLRERLLHRRQIDVRF